jgi:hypothetical protein
MPWPLKLRAPHYSDTKREQESDGHPIIGNWTKLLRGRLTSVAADPQSDLFRIT